MRASSLGFPFKEAFDELRELSKIGYAPYMKNPGREFYKIVYRGFSESYDLTPDFVKDFYEKMAAAALSADKDPALDGIPFFAAST